MIDKTNERRLDEAAYRRGFTHAIWALTDVLEHLLPEGHPALRRARISCNVSISMQSDGKPHPLFVEDFHSALHDAADRLDRHEDTPRGGGGAVNNMMDTL